MSCYVLILLCDTYCCVYACCVGFLIGVGTLAVRHVVALTAINGTAEHIYWEASCRVGGCNRTESTEQRLEGVMDN